MKILSSTLQLQGVVVWLIISLSSVRCIDVIRINADSGNDNECTLGDGSVGEVPCQSLEHISSFILGVSNLIIHIETDIPLRRVIQFINVSNITISGNSSEVTCWKGIETGFILENVNNLLISDMIFDQCMSHEKENRLIASIIIKHSYDIEMTYLSVTNSHYIGIVCLACYGTVSLEHVHFLSNGHGKTETRAVPKKSGAYFVINHPKPVVFIIKFCIFSNNTAYVDHPNAYYGENNTVDVHAYGGGLDILLCDSSRGNSITIHHTVFLHNEAHWGGGLHLNFQDTVQDNSLVVEESEFRSNTAHRGGGAASIVFKTNKNVPQNNSIDFSWTNFTNNSAKFGGGLAIAVQYSHLPSNQQHGITFCNCNWMLNGAVYSPAVDISPFYDHSYNGDRSGFLPSVRFHNIHIEKNVIRHDEKENQLLMTQHINSGVFVITQFSVFFSGCISFVNNSYSALHLTSAGVIFEENSNVSFSNNVAFNGGAIAMYGFSYLSVTVNSFFEFTDNIAIINGGGIYYHTIDQHDFITGSFCFLKYNGPPYIAPSDRNITFIFDKNTANDGGSAIYSKSFFNCFYQCEDRRYPYSSSKNHSIEDFVKCIGDFTIDGYTSKYNGSTKSFQSMGTEFHFSNKKSSLLKVIPGKTNVNFIPAVVKDQFNNIVNPLMTVSVRKADSNSTTGVHPRYSLTKNLCAWGYPGTTTTLSVTVNGVVGISFLLNVTFLDCPPGFYLESENNSCSCSADSTSQWNSAITKCNLSSFRAHIKRQHWAGYIHHEPYHPSILYHHEDLYFAPCFPPLCTNLETLLPNKPSILEDFICSNNRGGVMCGHCNPGYSVYYNSRNYTCSINNLCKFGPLFYMLSEIIPVVVLFSIIIIFDIDFTSGNSVGLIFFFQYLDITLDLNQTFSILREGYRLFYGIFNFQYFSLEPLSFCLWENFQILDIIVFKFVTILIAFTLVIGTIFLLRRNVCRKVCKFRTKFSAKTSFVPGISAFLVICYNQSTKTSFLILKYIVPRGIMDHPSNYTYTYYGGLRYFHGIHLLYAIPALFNLIVVTILPPLILLLYPLSLQLLSLCNLSEHRIVTTVLRMTYIHKLTPFIDCFQSCYRDNVRFFSGLYFVYRVALLCCFALAETDYQFRLSTEMLLVLFLGLHSAVQPYKKRLHNVIDSLLFFNLVAINLLAITGTLIIKNLDSRSDTEIDQSISLKVVISIQLILTYTPMLAVVAWFAIRGFQHFKRFKAYKRNYISDWNDMDDDNYEAIHSASSLPSMLRTSLSSSGGSLM